MYQKHAARRNMHAMTKVAVLNPLGMTRIVAAVIAIAALTFLLLPSPAKALDSENIRIAKALSNAYGEIVDAVGPAVVGIETEKTIPRGRSEIDMLERFFDQLPREFGPRLRKRMEPDNEPRKTTGIGSGIVIDRDGHILTNNHVIDDADTIKVELHNEKGKTYKAEIVGRDPNSDLAVIKLVNPPANLTVARLGDSDALKSGNIVLAIGSPLGFKESVSQGVVSAKGRTLNEIAYERFIQTDAAINPGNSGGPLVNVDGEVIGINTIISTRGGGSIGIGFAIPINQAKPVISQLIEKGAVTRGWLGIEMNPDDADISKEAGHDGTGVFIARVDPKGPAAKAGIRNGDLIISYDNISIKDNEHLRYLVAETEPGRDVPVTVLRDGERVKLSINIEPQPEDLFTSARRRGLGGPDGSNEEPTEVASSLGITVSNIDDEAREKYGIPETTVDGVVITKVDPESEAADKGIRPGTVIIEMDRLPVTDLTAFRKVLKDTDKDKVLLYLRYGEASRYMLLKLK